MFDLRLHEPAAYYDNEPDYPGFADYTCPQFVCDCCGEPLERYNYYYKVCLQPGSYRLLCCSCLLLTEAEDLEEEVLAAEEAWAAENATTAEVALAAENALTAEDTLAAEDTGRVKNLPAAPADPQTAPPLLCSVCGEEITAGDICFYEWSYLPATALKAPSLLRPAIGLTACYCEACAEECTIEPDDDLYEYFF